MIKHINSASFGQRYQHDAFMIDVRTPAEYRAEHVQGARLYPLTELNPQQVEQELLQQGLQAGQPVYVLCQAGQRALRAAELLAAQTALNWVVVEGGTNACAAANLPMQRSTSQAISLERQVRMVAGTLVLAGVVLGAWVNTGFYGLSAFVGAGLVFAGATDTCAMGLVLARMPWNK